MSKEEDNLRVQILQQQSEQIKEKLKEIAQEEEQLNELKKGLDEIKGELLSNYGGGVYFRTKVVEEDSFFVNIGKGIFIKKNKEEVKRLIEEQLKRISNAKEELMVILSLTDEQLEKLIKRIS